MDLSQVASSGCRRLLKLSFKTIS
ncbi:hypothetical protein LINPERPRIM_LOCUS16942 [Linum perenne]